ncbi:MAG: hypothetical protein PHQ86_04210 [Dehalococcoidales bacterium]|nr:hypothetical protein [Dehalococcoidales bacterium]
MGKRKYVFILLGIVMITVSLFIFFSEVINMRVFLIPVTNNLVQNIVGALMLLTGLILTIFGIRSKLTSN